MNWEKEMKIDKENYINKLKEEQGSDDTEEAHCNADDILCDVLIALGHQDIVDEYKKVNKWYS